MGGFFILTVLSRTRTGLALRTLRTASQGINDGPIAQLDRVADFYSAGCRFESCWDRHYFQSVTRFSSKYSVLRSVLPKTPLISGFPVLYQVVGATRTQHELSAFVLQQDSQRLRVVICGGGVIGACTAYFRARRGIEVMALERTEVAAAREERPVGFWRSTGLLDSALDRLARRRLSPHARRGAPNAHGWGLRRQFLSQRQRGAAVQSQPPNPQRF